MCVYETAIIYDVTTKVKMRNVGGVNLTSEYLRTFSRQAHCKSDSWPIVDTIFDSRTPPVFGSKAGHCWFRVRGTHLYRVCPHISLL